LRKLDDRSRKLVHLGTEPGSKAYRLLDPVNRKIVVSRDVVFDEEKGWDWNHNEPKQDGSLVSHLENSGIMVYKKKTTNMVRQSKHSLFT